MTDHIIVENCTFVDSAEPAPDSLGDVIKTLTENGDLRARVSIALGKDVLPVLRKAEVRIAELEAVRQPLTVDIGQAMSVLQQSPELAQMMNELVGAPALTETQTALAAAEARLAEAEAVIRTIAEIEPGTQEWADGFTTRAAALRMLGEIFALARASLHPQAPEDRKGEETI